MQVSFCGTQEEGRATQGVDKMTQMWNITPISFGRIHTYHSVRE